MKKIAIFLLLVVATFGVRGQAQRTLSSSNENVRLQSGRVVVFVVHPNIKESKANAALMQVARDMNLDVFELCKEKNFNVEAHREAITNASAVVFQFPVYFGGAPYKLKQWIDEVFYTFVEGPMLNGKTLLIAATTGSEEESYRSGGRNNFTMDELLRPFQMTANYSGMKWATPFIVYGMSTDNAASNLAAGVKEYRKVLDKVGRARGGNAINKMKHDVRKQDTLPGKTERISSDRPVQKANAISR